MSLTNCAFDLPGNRSPFASGRCFRKMEIRSLSNEFRIFYECFPQESLGATSLGSFAKKRFLF